MACSADGTLFCAKIPRSTLESNDLFRFLNGNQFITI
jgi:hypothetical protein